MATTTSKIPDKVFYHINSKTQSVSELLNSLYDKPSAEAQQHFHALNSHLKQTVQPGQVAFITPPGDQEYARLEPALRDAAIHIDKHAQKLTPADIKRINQRYEFLSRLADYSGMGIGASGNYLKAHKFRVERILKQIEHLYARTYNKYGKFQSKEFFDQRRNLFKLLDNELGAMVGRNQLGFDIDDANLKRSLGLSSKSLVRQLRNQPIPVEDIPGFAKNFIKLTDYGKRLGRVGLIGSIALDGITSYAKIEEACSSGRKDECTKTKFAQTGRFAGSVIGGYGGGELGAAGGYALCNLAFGVESFGTSLLWCGIIVGGISTLGGGYFGSKYGGRFTQGLGEDTAVLYENEFH